MCVWCVCLHIKRDYDNYILHSYKVCKKDYILVGKGCYKSKMLLTSNVWTSCSGSRRHDYRPRRHHNFPCPQ